MITCKNFEGKVIEFDVRAQLSCFLFACLLLLVAVAFLASAKLTMRHRVQKVMTYSVLKNLNGNSNVKRS